MCSPVPVLGSRASLGPRKSSSRFSGSDWDPKCKPCLCPTAMMAGGGPGCSGEVEGAKSPSSCYLEWAWSIPNLGTQQSLVFPASLPPPTLSPSIYIVSLALSEWAELEIGSAYKSWSQRTKTSSLWESGTVRKEGGTLASEPRILLVGGTCSELSRDLRIWLYPLLWLLPMPLCNLPPLPHPQHFLCVSGRFSSTSPADRSAVWVSLSLFFSHLGLWSPGGPGLMPNPLLLIAIRLQWLLFLNFLSSRSLKFFHKCKNYAAGQKIETEGKHAPYSNSIPPSRLCIVALKVDVKNL